MVQKQLALKKEIFQLSQIILKLILKSAKDIKGDELLDNINKIKE